MRIKKQKIAYATALSLMIAAGILMAVALFLPGCGSDPPPPDSQVTTTTGGGSSSTTLSGAGRASGMVVMKTEQAALARSAAREAAQTTVVSCGSVPAGYVIMPNATITISNETVTTTTDANGCFSVDIENPGIKIFTATKTNSKGGVTTLMRAANITQGGSVTFVNDDCISVVSTAAAMIIQSLVNGGTSESEISVDDINDLIQDSQSDANIAALIQAITDSADPDQTSVSNFDAINTTLVSNAQNIIPQPVITSPTVTWNNRSLLLTSNVVDDETVSSVQATITPANGGTPVNVTLTAPGTPYYSGVYTYSPVIPDSSFLVTLTSTDNDGVTYTYTGGTGAGGAIVTTPSGWCDDGTTQTTLGEQCDEGASTNTDTACTPAYDQTCDYCDTTCQSHTVPVAESCGDGTTNGPESCDDGADNGQPNKCNATCTGTTTPVCGNSVTESGENCDDGGESAACNSDCTTASCGDGKTNATANETCDDGVNNGTAGYCNNTCDGTVPACTANGGFCFNNSSCCGNYCYLMGSYGFCM